MEEYFVNVTLTLRKTVKVEAKSEQDAIRVVESFFNDNNVAWSDLDDRYEGETVELATDWDKAYRVESLDSLEA